MLHRFLSHTAPVNAPEHLEVNCVGYMFHSERRKIKACVFHLVVGRGIAGFAQYRRKKLEAPQA